MPASCSLRLAALDALVPARLGRRILSTRHHQQRPGEISTRAFRNTVQRAAPILRAAVPGQQGMVCWHLQKQILPSNSLVPEFADSW